MRPRKTMRPSEEIPTLTPQQRKVVSQLRSQYGEPDKMLICLVEGTGHGILRLDWCAQKRHLFIKPDGLRLYWYTVTYEPGIGDVTDGWAEASGGVGKVPIG